MLTRIAVVFLCFWTGACAVGVQHRYDAIDAKIDATTDSSVSVAVVDARPYVVSGEKPAKFVGLSRGGFGNPFDVTTATDKPLAEDMTSAIVSAMNAQNVAAKPVLVSPGATSEKALSEMLKSNANRNVMLILFEWKADTYSSTALNYDVTLRIFDRTGRERGKTRIDGRDNLGASAFNPPAHSRKVIPKAFKNKIEDLFSDPVIVRALK
ncbi:MAG: hypothetical protein HOM58_18930 [Rhodospirillaceae bacterium]|jgi:hypothetical protein|nr:hypothetical protein [Rhodospirillaceae bacterium]MBT5457182.1 hypothetical protein [Rhodospirillaceae bacterium]